MRLHNQAPINVEEKWTALRLQGRRQDWAMQWLRDPDGSESAAFVKGSEVVPFQGWAGLADCAHFMSNTLTAGGITGLKTDFVPYLNSFARKHIPFTKVLANEASGTNVQRIINKKLMKKGDLILYVAPPGGELGGGYVHSAMFVTDSTITCHTVSRWDEDWKAPHYNGYTFTLIHFGHDDQGMSLLDQELSGWWEITWRGRSYYYFFSKGKVSYSLRDPGSNSAPMVAPTQTGSYFTQSYNQVTICWPDTGTVEEVTVDVGNRKLSVLWNETERFSGKRRTDK
jgi:hypothetical protein